MAADPDHFLALEHQSTPQECLVPKQQLAESVVPLATCEAAYFP